MSGSFYHTQPGKKMSIHIDVRKGHASIRESKHSE